MADFKTLNINQGGTGANSAAGAKTSLGFISDVVDDTTPQLGGPLDANGQNITDVHEIRLDGLPDTDHTANGPTTDTFAAGYSSAIGDLVYMGSGGKWLEADASAVATCGGMLALALEAKTDTQAMKVALAGSFVRDDTWAWTVGATLYASETLGAITETAPTTADAVVRVVGFAVSADVMYFNPSSDHITVTG